MRLHSAVRKRGKNVGKETWTLYIEDRRGESGRAERRMRTEERVEMAVEQVAGEASAVVTANLAASNERAERIIASTAKLEVRQLWSAAAAMCLVLLPVVVVIAGLWMAIAGLITGASWH